MGVQAPHQKTIFVKLMVRAVLFQFFHIKNHPKKIYWIFPVFFFEEFLKISWNNQIYQKTRRRQETKSNYLYLNSLEQYVDGKLFLMTSARCWQTRQM